MMVGRLFWIISSLCKISVGEDRDQHRAEGKIQKYQNNTRDGKLLSLFTIVQFKNAECSVNNMTGSCITASQVLGYAITASQVLGYAITASQLCN